MWEIYICDVFLRSMLDQSVRKISKRCDPCVLEMTEIYQQVTNRLFGSYTLYIVEHLDVHF